MTKNKNNKTIWNTRIKSNSSALFQKVGGSIDIDNDMLQTGLAFNIFDSSRWETYIGHIISISKFCLVMAMSSIGLSTDIRSFKSIVINVLYYGLAVSFLVGMLSLALIYLLIY